MTDNELIAEFMGYQNEKWWHLNKHEFDPAESWDSLMPVVEKIESMHTGKFHYDPIEMAKGSFPKDNEYMDVICLPLATPIEEAYEAVVKFIKWHNSVSKT